MLPASRSGNTSTFALPATGSRGLELRHGGHDGGIELKTTKDGKGNISLSLKGHYDMTDTSKVPMEFYVKEAE